MLAAYLPPFVADALLSDLHATLPDLDHEHRKVTVAFVNVLGVDDLLASAGPDALVDEVQSYLEPVVRLVRENHGYLVSSDIYTNGFKLIVGFGVPTAHEHDAENALRFAATLRDEIDVLDLRLTHRIGVNGGFVFTGDVGPSYRRQYTVMGDAVNLSARLMGAAEPGQVIVSAHTAEAAGVCFLVRELAPIRVKGKEHPVEIVALEGQCEPAPQEAIAQDRFFGREDELADLNQALDDVEHGQGRAVVIRGEAGMGKSRLIAEFERVLPDRGWSVWVGRAYQHTSGQPFAPWVPVISAVIGLAPEDGDAARSRKTLAAVARTGPAFAEWASLLNPLLRLSLPESDLARSLDANIRRERMFDLVSALVRRTAEQAPCVIHLEDAHWADRSSLDLLSHMSRECESSRVLLLVSERIEGAPELDLPSETTRTIELVELPRVAALGLIGETLGIDLPREAAEVLLAKAKGNPLFLQEVARSIDRSGITAGAVDVRELVRLLRDVEVPDRVQGLLMSQIDSLSAPTRDVLRTASVVGTTFPVRTLRGAFGTAVCSDDLEARLSDLVAQSLLVSSTTGGERAFDFRHALIQEVAYDSLPFAKRRSLHHQVAEYLEDSHHKAPEAVYESLVHHYRLSGDQPKTRVFAVKAGEKARGLLASDQAIEYFDVGLDCTAARTPAAALARGYLLEEIGDCYQVTGRHHQAIVAYKDALERCRACESRAAISAASLLDISPEESGARNRVARLSHKIGVSYTRTHGDYDLSLRWLDKARRSMRPREAALGSRIDATRSVALLWTGEYEESVRIARHAYAAARRIADPEVEGRAASTLATAFQDLGDLRLSTRYRLKALESYEAAADVPAQAEAHNNLAATYISRGELDRALHHAREALQIDERTGDLTGEGMTRCNLAETLVMRGDYDEAIHHLGTAIALFERAGGTTHIMGFALMMLSRALSREGRHDEAETRLEEAVTLLTRSGGTTFLAEARLQRAEILLARGLSEEALSECKRGLEEARALGMRLMEIRGLWLLGLITAEGGDAATAERCLRESEDLARHADAPYERGVAQLALAELYAANGRPYRRPLSRALELLGPTGAAPDIERAKRLLAKSF